MPRANINPPEIKRPTPSGNSEWVNADSPSSKSASPMLPPVVPCLDCDAPAPRQVRRCDRCLDSLLAGLKRRADANARLIPLDFVGSGDGK